MSRIRPRLFSAKLLCLLLLLPSCSSHPPKEQRFRLTLPLFPTTLNPQLATDITTSSLLYPLYSSLFAFDGEGRIVPDIVEEYSWPTPRRLRLRIKEGLTFRNGLPLNGETVLANLRYFSDQKGNFPYASEFGFLESLSAKGQEVTLHLKHPHAPLLSLLTFKILLPSELGKERGRVVGTRGSVLFAHEGRSSLLLEVQGKTVAVSVEKDPLAAYLRLKRGESDAVFGHRFEEGLPLEEAGIESVGYSLSSLYYLAFNLRSPPLNSLPLREYLAASLSPGPFFALLKGHGFYSPFSLLQKDYRLPLPPSSRRPLSSRVPTLELLLNSESPLRSRYALLIQDLLSKRGIRVRILPIEYPAYLDRLKRGAFQLALGAFVFDADPHQGDLWGSEGGMNYSGLSLPEVDRLIERGREETDPSRRREIYLRLSSLVMAAKPLVFLPTPQQVLYRRKGLSTPVPELVASNSSALMSLGEWGLPPLPTSDR